MLYRYGFATILSLLLIIFSIVMPNSFLGVATVSSEQLEQWVWRNPLPQGGDLEDVTWGNNIFVAVGLNGTIVTSGDGDKWMLQYSGTTENLRKVIWGGSMFVATGDNGTVLTSPDGAIWTKRDSDTDKDLNAIAWGNDFGEGWAEELFVIVGDGVIIVSIDGEVWADVSLFMDEKLYSIAWNGKEFLAAGHNGLLVTSDNGFLWGRRNSGIDRYIGLDVIIWDGSQYIALGNKKTGIGSGFDSSNIYFSPDGVDWSEHSLDASVIFNDIIWTGSKYMAVGSSFYTSTDGVNWKENSFVSGGWANSLALDDSQFIAVGLNGLLLSSPDGVDWKEQRTGDTVSSYNDILWDGNEYSVVGSNGIFKSEDGISWSKIELMDALWLNSIAKSDTTYVAVGSHNVVSYDGKDWEVFDTDGNVFLNGVAWLNGEFIAVGALGAIYSSPDGIDWTKRLLETDIDIQDITWNGVQYVAVGFNYINSPKVLLTSSDGETWVEHSPGIDDWLYLYSVTWGNGIFVAVGDNGLIISSPDGINWTKQDYAGYNNFLKHIIWTGSHFVAVGSEGLIISSDGTTWTKRTINANLNAITWSGNQYVTVGRHGAILTSGILDKGKEQHHIKLSSKPTGGGTVSGGGVFDHGNAVTVVAKAHDSYVFVNWTEDDKVVSDKASYSFKVKGDRVLVANYSPKFKELENQVEEYLEKRHPNISRVKDYNGVLDPGATSDPQVYKVSAGKDVVFSVAWSGSKLKLSVIDPDGNLYKEVEGSKSPISLVNQNAGAGDWAFTVTGVDVPHVDYPYVAMVGEFLYGDINNDGKINVSDVVLVMRHVLEIEKVSDSKLPIIDVNGDGDINVLDVTLIMRRALGLIDEFPL